MENEKCPYCDAKRDGEETRCVSCGKDLGAAEAPTGEKKGGSKIFAVLVILLVFAGGGALMLFTGVIPNPFTGRGAAAIVNGEKISWQDVDQKVEIYTKIYAQSGAARADFNTPEGKKMLDSIQQQVLNGLIQEKVLLTEAKRENIAASPKEVEDRIDAVKKGMNMSDKDFEAFLKGHAMSMDNLKKRIENETLITKLVEKAGAQSGANRDEWFQKLNARASVKTFPKK